jgi:copper transport protein
VLRPILTLCAIALAALLSATRPALAHAALIATTPTDGAVLQESPSVVQLRFNEPVSPLMVQVIDARGQTRRGLGVTARNETVEVALPADLPWGTQVVSYRVVSADGHPIGGSLVFSIGAPTGAPALAPETTDKRVRPLIWLARVALTWSLFTGVGGAFFAAWISPGRPTGRRFLLPTLGVGFVATVFSVGLQGIDVLGAGLLALITTGVWTAGLSTSLGPAAAAASTALIAAALSLSLHSPWSRILSGAGLLLVGVSFALTGHASAADPQWLTRPAVFLHGVGAAYWIGALVPLLALLRRGEPALAIVQRFSAVAVPLVAALVLSGVALAVVQVGSLSALNGTAYGRVLLAKLAAVVLLLALAALNRFSLTPALATPGSERRLAWSIATEIALVAAILALAALWRFTPPPRALALEPPHAAEPAVALIHGERTMAEVTFTPGRAGPVQATIAVMGHDHAPIEVKEVVLLMALPSQGVEAIERKATRLKAGLWQIDSMPLPLPGCWQVRIDALISDFEKAVLEDRVTIAGSGGALCSR